jgi:uncharacterized YccA/Bax inhibitor family protein
MDGISFLILSLACWRLTRLLVYDYGPLHVFEKFRQFVARWGFTHELFSCHWCLSVWVGLVFGLAWRPGLMGLVAGLAMAGIAGMLCELEARL